MSAKRVGTSYVVGEPRQYQTLQSAPKGNADKHAVLVVHGMGQQKTFETLATVAERLRGSKGKTTVRAVRVAEERLHRAELEVDGREVHVYEAYWAPLTEGRITLRDVIRFLLFAGIGGILGSFSKFRRWMFGDRWTLKRAVGTPFWCSVALTIVVSLMLMNFAVGTVGTMRLLNFSGGAKWPTPQLMVDLNVTASIVVSVLTMTASILWFAMRTKRASARERTRERAGATRGGGWIMSAFGMIPTWLQLASLGAVIIGGAGVMIRVLFYHRDCPDTIWWIEQVGAARVAHLTTVTLTVFLASLAFGALALLPWSSRMQHAWIAVALFASAAAFVWLVAFAPGSTAWNFAEKSAHRFVWAWPLLIGLTAVVRTLLVQFVGDVAAYVTPQHLDKFHQLREDIKACALRVANAVYSASPDGRTAEYASVTVVGHSLGSVVAYDTLNRLIEVDSFHGDARRVVARTAGLLTFGSPLDKIAYIFSLRRDSELADALAASTQPMLLKLGNRPVRRFAWVNLWSPHDIISGALDYFDVGGAESVINVRDRYASIPLVAHTEYWSNDLLWKTLRALVTGIDPRKVVDAHPELEAAAALAMLPDPA